MTSHVHLILSVQEGFVLSDVIRDFKSYTATKIKKAITENSKESRREWMLWMFERAGKKNKRNNEFQFWQQHNHPIELNNHDIAIQRLQYVHNNLVVAGFVEKSYDWLWSSSADYEKDIRGKIEIVYLE